MREWTYTSFCMLLSWCIYIYFCLQVQTKLLELKELENNQFSWHSQPHNTLVNGTVDHSSLSNSSSETANLNENAERESIAEDEQTHSVSPVSSVLTACSWSSAAVKLEKVMNVSRLIMFLNTCPSEISGCYSEGLFSTIWRLISRKGGNFSLAAKWQ